MIFSSYSKKFHKVPQGLTFPGVQGHMPLGFLMAQNSMYNNQKSGFRSLIFYQKTFSGPHSEI